MKRFITAICIMLVLICICFVSLKSSRASTAMLLEAVDEISQSISGDSTQVSTGLDSLVLLWHERQDVLAHHMRHDSMDEIATALVHAQVYAADSAWTDLKCELAELRRLFADIKGREEITLNNVL